MLTIACLICLLALSAETDASSQYRLRVVPDKVTTAIYEYVPLQVEVSRGLGNEWRDVTKYLQVLSGGPLGYYPNELGVHTIQFSHMGATGTCEITVIPAPTLRLIPDRTEANYMEWVALRVEADLGDGNGWVDVISKATLTGADRGGFQALKFGQNLIKAKYMGVVATCMITVKSDGRMMRMTPVKDNVIRGDWVPVTLEVNLGYGNGWRDISDEYQRATGGPAGFMATELGTHTYSLYYMGATATCEITSMIVPSLRIVPDRLEVKYDEWVRVTVEADIDDGNGWQPVTVGVVLTGAANGGFRADEVGVHTVTATYMNGYAECFVTVVPDCGAIGFWNSNARKCDCHDPYIWHAELGECVMRTDVVEPDILEGIEQEFVETVRQFDEHHQNFLSRFRALAAADAEAICSDGNLAFSVVQADQRALLANSYLETATDLAFTLARSRLVQEHGTASGQTISTDAALSLMDQIRMDMMRSENSRVQQQSGDMFVLISRAAPGCDGQEVLDNGNRVAEGSQDAETGTDGDWTSPDPGGGGGTSGGGLRFEPSSSIDVRTDTSAQCPGGLLSLNITDYSFPTEIRADQSTYTVSITVNWSTSGSDVGSIEIGAFVWFLNVQSEAQTVNTYSGTKTFRFTFNRSEVNFDITAGSIILSLSGSLICDTDADVANSQFYQQYMRRGSD
jgi:hypothetical protein